MAITVTNRKGSTSGTDASSYDWTLSGLTTGTWLVVDFNSEQASGFPTHNTPSGGGLTYAQKHTVTNQFTRRLTRFIAWNPDQTAFTLTTSTTTTQLSAMCHVNEIAGADTTDPFVESYSASATSGTTATVTMSAYADSGNRYLFTICLSTWGGSGITPEGTELNDNYISSGGGGRIESQWHASTQDTTPSGSWLTSEAWRCIASEIKVSGGAAGGEVIDPMGMMGFFGA